MRFGRFMATLARRLTSFLTAAGGVAIGGPGRDCKKRCFHAKIMSEVVLDVG
jgi:hypothetical protein